MATIPLDTLACTIDENGCTAPEYADILATLQFRFRSIYGSDVYLEADSQDGQLLGVFALAIHNANQQTVAVYNAFSPTSAQGAGLSSVVKINGLRRLSPTNSQAPVLVVGQVGTPIINGTIRDENGNLWNLPPVVDIPISGEVTVTATAQEAGAIVALANTITTIYTPTRGWQTVTNPADAVTGAPVERDAVLRRRQSESTALPALTPVEAIEAAVANVEGVLRYKVYENDTGITDANGVPRNSIAVVVEGGDVTAIANAISSKKGPGAGTYGTTSVVVTDQYGMPKTIHFFEVSIITVTAIVTLAALAGFVSTTEDLIKDSLIEYLAELEIGEDAYLTRLWSPVNLSGDAAVTATGQTQLQLDALSATYNGRTMLLAREDMVITGGPYMAGATTIHVTHASDYHDGDLIAITLDNTTRLTALVVGAPVGTAVTFAPAIPGGRQTNNGAFVFVANDLTIAFNEAAETDVADLTVTAS